MTEEAKYTIVVYHGTDEQGSSRIWGETTGNREVATAFTWTLLDHLAPEEAAVPDVQPDPVICDAKLHSMVLTGAPFRKCIRHMGHSHAHLSEENVAWGPMDPGAL